jgi:hypothetical protein
LRKAQTTQIRAPVQDLPVLGTSRLHSIRLTSSEASTSTWLWSSCSLILLPCKVRVRHVVQGGLVTMTLLKSSLFTPNRSLTPHLKPQGRYTPIPIPLPIPRPIIPRPGRFCLYLPNFNPGARVHRRQRFSSRSYWYCMDITRVCFHNHPSPTSSSLTGQSYAKREGSCVCHDYKHDKSLYMNQYQYLESRTTRAMESESDDISMS